MRVAVLKEDNCQPKKCNDECQVFCPPVRNGQECIIMDENTGKPHISESLCIGCGICETECPVKDERAVYVTAVGESRSDERKLLLREREIQKG